MPLRISLIKKINGIKLSFRMMRRPLPRQARHADRQARLLLRLSGSWSSSSEDSSPEVKSESLSESSSALALPCEDILVSGLKNLSNFCSCLRVYLTPQALALPYAFTLDSLD